MDPEQRELVLLLRQWGHRPWHSPPHRRHDHVKDYLFTAACFNHAPVIGSTLERMVGFENLLLDVADQTCAKVHAWVLLPNHYHFLARTEDCLGVITALGKLHGGTSFRWNGEESARGRQVWCRGSETVMKSDRHFWATINYIHHNPVKHGHVKKWQHWPFGSAVTYLKTVGSEEAERTWSEYPIGNYVEKWDL